MPIRVSYMCIRTLRAACEREKCGSTVSVAALMAATILPPGAGWAPAVRGSAGLASPAPPSLSMSRRDFSRIIVASPCRATIGGGIPLTNGIPRRLNAGMDKPEIVFLGTGPDWHVDRFAQRFTLHFAPGGDVTRL